MTLRSALNRMMLVAFALVMVIAVGVLFGYSQVKQTLARKTVEDSLVREASIQVDALLPSFLVPEQRSSIEVLLERFRAQEGLSEVRIVQSTHDLPTAFLCCRLAASSEICLSTDHDHIGVTSPIGEPVQGYLFKAIPMPNPLADDYLLQVIEVTTAILLISFFSLFLVLSRAATQELPRELDKLVAWVESIVSEKSDAQQPKLRLTELNTLGAQIAEIIERNRRAQDQAVVGQIASGIIHDIKTPLHSVVTAISLAQEQQVGSPKRVARLENLLKVCAVNIPIVGDIIETALDGSREIHLATKKGDVRETLETVLTSQAPLIRQRGVDLAVDLGDSPLSAEHDSVQLSRVFANILKNAVEAIPRDQMAKIQIQARALADRSVSITIEDNGTGLPKDSNLVFRAFRTSKPRGTGLGLVVSKKIIEAHRGALHASRSEALGGARFEVTLQPEIAQEAVQ